MGSRYTVDDDKEFSVKMLSCSDGIFIRVDDIINWLKSNQDNMNEDNKELIHTMVKILIRFKNREQ